MRCKLVLLLSGIVGTLFPKAVIDGAKTLLLWPTYENPADLEPRSWFVTSVRVQSLLLAAVVLYTMTDPGQRVQTDIPDEPDLTPAAESED
ncbi:hypothetical protein [Halodesulfurarchaeum sp.]|uniref:hypothetical protein n=1 Tax=Halodesulfurarchaeum sp. TaxID=1980530 RepID=UPI001BC58C82|nr:hypothetical protein [Halodesulfurarchaeum sp.]